MKNIYRHLSSLLLCWLSAVIYTFPCRAAEKGNRYQDARSGVVIICDAEKLMFPAEWRVPPVSATAASLGAGDVDGALRVVLTGLAKYPFAFLQKSLKTIYLVQKLAYYKTEVGGLGDDASKTLYLNVYGEVSGYTPEYINFMLETALHHELAHVLIANNADKFSVSRWQKLNPTGFHYSGNLIKNIRRHAYDDTEFETKMPACWKQGFASKYGTASVDEDIATMGEKLFLGTERFWQAVDQSSVLKKKVEMLIAFYHALDSAFTPFYFRKLASDPLPPTYNWTTAAVPLSSYAPGDVVVFASGGRLVLPGSASRIVPVPVGGLGVCPSGSSFLLSINVGAAGKALLPTTAPPPPVALPDCSLVWTPETGWLMVAANHGLRMEHGALHLHYQPGDTLYFPYGGLIYVPGQAEPETMLSQEREIYRAGYAVIFNPRSS